LKRLYERGDRSKVPAEYAEKLATHNPPHPGRIVRQECLEAIRLSVTEATQVLDVTRQTLDNLVNEKAGISAEMAVCLEKAFGGAADAWLRVQSAYDLARTRNRM